MVNFVAQGTIEEGMLSVLAFKKSLFEGVLDGGQSDVSLQGTRLSRFMKSVDEVTGAMGEAEPVEPAPATHATSSPPQNAAQPGVTIAETEVEPTSSAPLDPWGPLIDVGLKLVETLAAASDSNGTKQNGASPSWIETDTRTGQRYLKLPVPEPAAVQRLADALSGFLSGLRR